MSNKFTGITSGGQFIPVYDKDTHSALSGKQDKLSAGSNIQIENNIISVTGEMGKVYSGEGGVTVDNINDKISLDASAQSAIEAFKGEFDLSAGTNISFRTEGQTVYIDSDAAPLPEYVTEAANYVSAQSGTWDSVTGKQAAGDYYSASNPSGFLIADDITGKMDVTGMTAYQPAGDYQPSGDYLSASESANFYPMTGNPSGFLTEHQSLDGLMETSGLEYDGDKISGYMGSAFAGGGEVPEGVMVESAVGYNAVNEISGYNGSAIAQYGAEKQWLVHDDTLVHAANSAQYALGVNLSAVAQLLGIDETVLWEGSASTGTVMELSAPLSAFRQAKLYMMEPTQGLFGTFDFISGVNYNNCSMLASISRPDNAVWSGSVGLHKVDFKVYDGTTKLSGINNNQLWLNVSSIIPEIVKGNGGSYGWRSNTGCKYKVIGIGRKQ